MISRDINKLAKFGMWISIITCCVIGGGMIYLAFGSYYLEKTMIWQGVIVILGGILGSTLTWGLVGTLSDLAIEAQRIRELLEQNVVDSNKK